MDEKLLDSRYADGFLVHLLYCLFLPWMAVLLNLSKYCMCSFVQNS